MKKNTTSFLILLVAFTVSIVTFYLITDNGNYAVYASSGGSPGGKTGSPADGNNCTQCHSGTLNPGNAARSITSAGLSGGYVPGQTYTINAAITGTSSSKIGFEVTVERNSTNAKTGTIVITNPTRTKTVNVGKAVTHNSSAGSAATSGSNAWTFDWIAPVAGTGAVTFYGNFNATNSNGGTSGDQVYTATFNVNENTSVGIAEVNGKNVVKLYPNPTSEYFKVLSGEKVTQVEVFNLAGQKLLEEKNSTNNINVQNLKPGIYMVKINLLDAYKLQKLIIQ